ncbi:MAG: molybdenum cofactor biosynthesis protein B [Parvularculales bacterium]
MTGIDESRPFLPVRIAVLTVSDSRTPETDTSGQILVERLTGAGHILADRALVADDQTLLKEHLTAWIADETVEVVIATGGTGLTARDVTPEVFHTLYDKEIEGFSAVFHRISFEIIGVSTIQSRATAGVAGSTYIFALPGSPGAVKDGWDEILRYQLDNRFQPCNLAELIPRLQDNK